MRFLIVSFFALASVAGAQPLIVERITPQANGQIAFDIVNISGQAAAAYKLACPNGWAIEMHAFMDVDLGKYQTASPDGRLAAGATRHYQQAACSEGQPTITGAVLADGTAYGADDAFFAAEQQERYALDAAFHRQLATFKAVAAAADARKAAQAELAKLAPRSNHGPLLGSSDETRAALESFVAGKAPVAELVAFAQARAQYVAAHLTIQRKK